MSDEKEKSFQFKLTEDEKVKLAEIRKAIAAEEENDHTQWLKNTKDHECIRFLRGHKHCPKTAHKMLLGTSKWRHERKIDEVVVKVEKGEHETIRKLKCYYPTGQLGDKDGHQVVLYRMAMVDFPALLKAFTAEDVAILNSYSLEQAWRTYPQGNNFLIIDLGWSEEEKKTTLPDYLHPVDSLWKVQGYVSALMKTVKVSSAEVDPNFPESFQKIFIVRVPSIFWASWKVAKYFVAERTRSKIEVLSSEKTIYSTLKQYLSDELIPTYLGGKHELTSFPPGGKYELFLEKQS